MRLLVILAVVSFCALAGAAFAIARHIRRTTAAGLTSPPSQPDFALPTRPSQQPLPITPKAGRAIRYATGQRYDRVFSSDDSGNLNDPGEPRTRSNKISKENL